MRGGPLTSQNFMFHAIFLFKRVGKPPLTKLKKDDNTQPKLPSSAIFILGPSGRDDFGGL